MADVLAAMQALAAQLADETGTRAYTGNVDDPTVPCWIVMVPSVDYLEDFGGGTKLMITVRYLVDRTNEKAAQRAVMGVMADGGVVADALDADETLDDNVDWTALLRARNFGSYTYGEATYLGCEFDVEAGTS